MADQIDHLEVGRIGKAHGIGGEVVVTFISERAERREPGAVVTTDAGDLTVVSARPHQAKWLVRFDGIDNRNRAEELRGLVISAPPIDPGNDDTLWVHQLVGCRVVDTEAVDRGRICEIQANPASDLLVLDNDTLVPLRFVVDGPTDGVVTVDAPAGLFTIDELDD